MNHRRPVCWILHGFNVWDGGKGTVDKLIPYFEQRGWHCLEFDYGWLGLLGVRLFARRFAKMLARLVEPGDIGCGHSHGCATLHLASHYGAQFRQLIYVAPALDRDAVPAPQVEHVDVFFTAGDPWPRLARWLPWHLWGDMGAHGYEGDDQRMENHDAARAPAHHLRVMSHGGYFRDGQIQYWGRMIAGCVRIVSQHGCRVFSMSETVQVLPRR